MQSALKGPCHHHLLSSSLSLSVPPTISLSISLYFCLCFCQSLCLSSSSQRVAFHSPFHAISCMRSVVWYDFCSIPWPHLPMSSSIAHTLTIAPLLLLVRATCSITGKVEIRISHMQNDRKTDGVAPLHKKNKIKSTLEAMSKSSKTKVLRKG